jgi:Flp pilus assembly protein TadD
MRVDSEIIQRTTAAPTTSGVMTAPTGVSGRASREVIADSARAMIHHPALGVTRSRNTTDDEVGETGDMRPSSHSACARDPLCRVAP